MQTFLPFPDMRESAQCLDRQRLGKQRVETMQIMRAITDPTYGWQSHPAVRMWRGEIHLLYDYQYAVCTEWTGRGYRDTCLDKTFEIVKQYDPLIATACAVGPEMELPYWFGDPAFHRSHQSNLLRKNPDHYGPMFDGVPDDLEYVWPT